MTYPTDFTRQLRNAIWHTASAASTDVITPGDIERYMIAYIQTRWPNGAWRSLHPDEVVGAAYEGWLNRPAAYVQTKLI